MTEGKLRMDGWRDKIERRIWEIQHKSVRRKYRRRFTGSEPTIISCNCTGGILYHELGIAFASPTINLYMMCEDFIKFCENMKYYLSLDIEEYDGEVKRDYPLGKLGDLVIYFVHYESLEQAREKWNERKKRINWENIYIIATDRDGFNQELLERFEALLWKNKKIFTHLPHGDCKDAVYIRGYENEEQIEGLHCHTKGGHFLIDRFDWVNWLNGEK